MAGVSWSTMTPQTTFNGALQQAFMAGECEPVKQRDRSGWSQGQRFT
jgi:hypothetical protein